MKKFNQYSQDKYEKEELLRQIKIWVERMAREIDSPHKSTAVSQGAKDFEEGYVKGRRMGVKIAATVLLNSLDIEVPNSLNMFRD